MRNNMQVRARHELAADGVLITSGLFALACAVLLPLLWLVSDEPLAEGTVYSNPAMSVVATLMNIVMLGSVIAGPWLTWTLHGRTFTWKVAVAGILSIPVATLLAGAFVPLLNRMLHPIAALVSDEEYAAPIAVGILAGGVYLLVIARAARATFFEYGGPVPLIRVHQASLIGLALIVAELVVGIGLMGVDGSMAEVLAFGMLFGFGGGVAVWAADLASGQRPFAGTKPTAA